MMQVGSTVVARDGNRPAEFRLRNGEGIAEASSLLHVERRTRFVETGGEFRVMRPPRFVINLDGRQPFVYERTSGESVFVSNLLEEVVHAVPVGFALASELQQKIVIRFQLAIHQLLQIGNMLPLMGLYLLVQGLAVGFPL